MSALYGPIERLAQTQVVQGKAADAIDDVPRLRYLRDINVMVMMHDIFAETEIWTNSYFGLDRAERCLADYGRPYKLAVCNYVNELQIPMIIMRALFDIGVPKSHVLGVNRALGGLDKAYHAEMPAHRSEDEAGIIRIFGNFLIFLATMLISAIWIVSRIRVSSPQPRECFLAVDELGDDGNNQIVNECAPHQDTFFVLRDDKIPIPPGIQGPHCSIYPKDITWNTWSGAKSIAHILQDSTCVFLFLWRADSCILSRALMLVRVRQVQRALFHMIRPKFFWGRDPYNPAHIIRRQELHRVGAQSHGILHGFGALTDIYPMFRYIDFDRFYVFGSAIADIYRETWASDMSIEIGGGFRQSRQLLTLVQEQRDQASSIAVFLNVLALANESKGADIIRALAADNPRTEVLLQIKGNVIDRPEVTAFLEAAKAGFGNIRVVTDSVPSVLARAKVAFSDPSTVVIEAIELGVPTFAIDVLADHKKCIFRKWSWMCVSTPEDAIARATDIIENRTVYPFSECKTLTNTSGKLAVDSIREGFELSLDSSLSVTNEMNINA